MYSTAVSLATEPEHVTAERTFRVSESVLPESVARPFYGVVNLPHTGPTTVSLHGSKPTMVVAGGSFFDRSPNDGGTKQYSDRITLIQIDNGQPIVTPLKDRLPVPVAEGLSITLPDGILMLGGVNQTGELSQVYKWQYSRGQSRFVEFPPLPKPAKMLAGGLIGHSVYVLIGNELYSLDLTKVSTTSDTLVAGEWQACRSLPGPRREQAASAVQGTDQKKVGLFVFGGIDLDSPNTPALTDVWLYLPGTDSWKLLGNLEDSTIGAIAVPSGCQSILLVGGFNRQRWDSDSQSLASLTGQELTTFVHDRFAAPAESFHWYDRLLAWHTVPNSWTRDIDAPVPNQLTTATCGSAVAFLGKTLVVAGGEDKPASRLNIIQLADFTVKRSFGWINWTVLLVYLAMLLPMGWFFLRRGNGTADDFFKGGGRIPWWVNGISIYATMLSSITFIAIPTMTYLGDWRYYPSAVMIFVTTAIVIFFFIPRFRQLNIICAYEYLEQRYNIFARVFASGAFILFMIARSAIVLYIPSLALNTVAGINIYQSILLIGSVTVIYSAMGGMEAVVWSDFIQAIVLIGGAVVLLVFLVVGAGGVETTYTCAAEAGKTTLWDFGWDWAEPVMWVMVLGGLAQSLATYTSDQTVIQRYVTMKDTRSTARSMWLSGIMSTGILLVFYSLGTSMFAYYHNNPCDMDVVLPQNDSTFPTYMVTQLPAGVSGLLIAAIFAATMSTLSSNFNSAAAAFVSDFFCRFLGYKPTDKVSFHMAIAATVFVGVMGIGCAVFLASIPDIKSIFDVFLQTIGVLTGGICGLFILGFFFPRVGAAGAILGLATSYAVNYILIAGETMAKFGLIIPDKPHPMLYSAVSLLTCIGVGVIISLILPAQKKA